MITQLRAQEACPPHAGFLTEVLGRPRLFVQAESTEGLLT
jgi:hypothetical protein